MDDIHTIEVLKNVINIYFKDLKELHKGHNFEGAYFNNTILTRFKEDIINTIAVDYLARKTISIGDRVLTLLRFDTKKEEVNKLLNEYKNNIYKLNKLAKGICLGDTKGDKICQSLVLFDTIDELSLVIDKKLNK